MAFDALAMMGSSAGRARRRSVSDSRMGISQVSKFPARRGSIFSKTFNSGSCSYSSTAARGSSAARRCATVAPVPLGRIKRRLVTIAPPLELRACVSHSKAKVRLQSTVAKDSPLGTARKATRAEPRRKIPRA